MNTARVTLERVVARDAPGIHGDIPGGVAIAGVVGGSLTGPVDTMMTGAGQHGRSQGAFSYCPARAPLRADEPAAPYPARGRARAELRLGLVARGYELARDVCGSSVRPNGKLFLCHLVGTAQVAVRGRAREALVASYTELRWSARRSWNQ